MVEPNHSSENGSSFNRSDPIRNYDLGCYVSERSWGTVREDNSPANDPWTGFDFTKAINTPFRYGEDAIAGFCDFRQNFVFSFVFWNGKDPILKERLFGLSNHEGNHGEDVKEIYYHLSATKDHSYVEYLYKYPVKSYPYQELVEFSKKRSTLDREYEIYDTDVFEEGYFDIKIEYFKHSPYDVFVRLEVKNQSDHQQSLHILPQLQFRNRWKRLGVAPPTILLLKEGCLKLDTTNLPFDDTRQGNWKLPDLFFHSPFTKVYFTENEEGLKGAFHDFVIHKKESALNSGSKAAFYSVVELAPQASQEFIFRLSDELHEDPFDQSLEKIENVKNKAKDFFSLLALPGKSPLEKEIIIRAASGLCYSKTYYEYNVRKWLDGTKEGGRNRSFIHLNSYDVLSIPDKWEYPWFAAWDMGFQAMSFGYLDIDYGKKIAWYLLSDRIMHPNGMLPGYEWEFSSVNPPVHAFSVLRLFRYEKEFNQIQDIDFLKKCFERLTIHFTWWVNRKDRSGLNVFEGGFCGFDNISVVDRETLQQSQQMIEQSDSTSWMALFALVMMRMALEIAKVDPVFEVMGSKYLRHFALIASGFSKGFDRKINNWSEEDGFFYDVMRYPDGKEEQMKIKSVVGIVPTFAFEWIDDKELEKFKEFSYLFNRLLRRLDELTADVVVRIDSENRSGYLLVLAPLNRLEKVLQKIFDPNEFLSPYGIRSLSFYHKDHPVNFYGQVLSYEPNESTQKIMGGNSNWRGPIWLPINYMIFDLLLKIEDIFGKNWKLKLVDGREMTAIELANDLKNRLTSLFAETDKGRPIYGGHPFFLKPETRRYLQFFEYFNPDTGQGLGASHQTGWTALIANMIIRASRASP